MSWLNKCCIFLPLDLGCLLLGGFTFVFSLGMVIQSVVLLLYPDDGILYLKRTISLEMNVSFLEIIFSFITIVDIMWMFFSVMLIYGIAKNRSNFVLSYFFFGIIVTILVFMSGLLVLLQWHWVMMVVELFIALLYSHCLIAVHSAYEQMQRGKIFNLYLRRQANEEQLIVA